MTQAATAESVRGRFDGRPVTYWGLTVRPVQRDGGFWFEYYRPGESEPITRVEILRTVGSHRYQQYLARVEGEAGNYYRLQLFWHIQEQRWMHMNGAFLGPDRQSFDNHIALWNHNCIFCHNTGPEPGIVNIDEIRNQAALGRSVDMESQAQYRSRVAELGIACESCHGPGAAHVEANRNPLRRLWHRLRGSDETVVHPDKLPQERSVQVCGQCHGQRTPADPRLAQRWVNEGPTYRPGDDLLDTVNLVWRDTRIPGDTDPDRFRLRFWADSTPRLTAYEYQGLKLSECFTQSETLTCNTCHEMHAGDPDGMTTERQRSNARCRACHQELGAGKDRHTRHAAASEGSDCYACHMPEIVYGVMTTHRSHRIEVPDPAGHAADGRPNACNQCHVDRSVTWAERETARLWGGEAKPVARPSGVEPGYAAGIIGLTAGDPLQRSMAARHIRRGLERGDQSAHAWARHLIATMREDDYPAVRRFAAQAMKAAAAQLGAKALETALAEFDFIAAAEQREAALQRVTRRWAELAPRDGEPGAAFDGQAELTLETLQRFRAIGRQRSEGISVGE